jgi:rare lipoprotein A
MCFNEQWVYKMFCKSQFNSPMSQPNFRLSYWFWILGLMLAVGCSHAMHSKKQTSPRTHTPEIGEASYYGSRLEGRRTANGEIYRPNLFTCAHRSLPWGTQLRITNLENGKSVAVRVNDRGPFVRGRIVDLSQAAARKLGILKSGHAKVRIQQMSP